MFAHLKVKTKILAGFAVILAILVVVSGISIRNFSATQGAAETYSQRVKTVAIARQLERDALDLRRFAREYALTGRNDDATKTMATAESIRGQIAKGLVEIHNPERHKRVEDMSGRFEAYMANFAKLHAQREEEDRLIAEVMDPSGAKFHKDINELGDMAAKAGNGGAATLIQAITEHGLLARLYANQMIGRRDTSFAAKAKGEFQDLGQKLTALEPMVRGGAMQGLFADIKALAKRYEESFDRVAQLSAANTEIIERVNAKLAAEFADDAAYVKDSGIEDEHKIEADMHATIGSAKSVTLILAFVGLGLGIACAFALGSIISRPVVAITGVMGELAANNLAVAVPFADRGDEIGEMAKSVAHFKDQLVRVRQLEADQEEQKRQAEADRLAALRKLADMFESSVGNVIGTVTSAATQLQAASGQMAGTAAETSAQATTVASAAQEASANVETVAAATEELASSIKEIAHQVQRSQAVSARAQEEAEATTGQIRALSDNAHKIGEIVNLINDIAAQTNLLALNATIEAARAGDAGKGFAVVANEVKHLATQTGKATEEIAAQIRAVQEGTSNAVHAIDSISRVIGEMGEIGTAVAAAVEQQSGATGEIARNVEQAAAGTGEVSSNIVSVEQAARETGSAAEQIKDSASDLAKQAEVLRHEVSQFLTHVRADKQDMKLLHWSSDLEFGIASIDRHHQHMFDQINDFYRHLMSGDGGKAAITALSQVCSTIKGHFEEEEALMAKHGYGEAVAHRAQHADFLSRIGDLRAAVEANRPDAGPRLFDYLSTWLQEHIRKDDKALSEFLRDSRAA